MIPMKNTDTWYRQCWFPEQEDRRSIMEKKVMTDADVKKKAVKSVVAHIRKKIDGEFEGQEHILRWLESMETILEKDGFEKAEYIEMRKELNDVIERTIDGDMRLKFRDSWYSFGKALDKKVKKQ